MKRAYIIVESVVGTTHVFNVSRIVGPNPLWAARVTIFPTHDVDVRRGMLLPGELAALREFGLDRVASLAVRYGKVEVEL